MTTKNSGDMHTHKIGELLVYKEQVRCAHKIIEVFSSQCKPPLLIAQMQQGKTGTVICVIDQFANNCEALNLKYEIIYLTNIADNSLKAQNAQRLLVAGYGSKVRVLHHSDLRNGGYECDSTVDRRLVIIDECHYALGKKKPFDKFLKECAIDYGKSIDCWQNKNNFVLSVSATPSAHIIKVNLDNSAFEPVVLEVNDQYYSLQHLKKANRLFKSEAVVKGGKPTKFFNDRMDQFLNICKTDGNGHMVVRGIGKSPEILKKHIQQNYPGVDVQIFESNPTDNIGELDETLSLKLARPHVAIIRGSMRAGKTLRTTRYIHMWIESPNSKTDTMCQAVGRCLGHEMIEGKNRKFEDKFPIYCNTKEIDIAIEFYNTYKCVPSGNWNKTVQPSKSYTMHVFDHKPSLADRPWMNPDEESAHWVQKLSTYPSKAVEALQKIGEGCRHHGNYGIFYMDSLPPNVELSDTSKEMETYKKYEGKYLDWEPIIIEPNFEKKLREDAILNDETSKPQDEH